MTDFDVEKQSVNQFLADAESVKFCSDLIYKCRTECSKRIIGQKAIVDGILMAFIAGGHVLLEGVPGLAKTLAVRTFAEISGLEFKRIQFTPDLLPADISGTLMYEQATGKFIVRKGPVFTNVVLADEINRAPAKVQSALLESMAEHQVTIGEKTYVLPDPFFVLATQNPLEQEGIYSLPEAELDRFLIKLVVPYPTPDEERCIVKTEGNIASVPVNEVFSSESLKKCRLVAGAVSCDEKLVNYIVSLINVTRPSVSGKQSENHITSLSAHHSDFVAKYISCGASPRAGIAVMRCAKVAALFAGRSYVLPEDIKTVFLPVVRHRLILSYEAAADNISSADVIEKILAFVPLP